VNTILFLARHGETVDNVRQLIQGQTQGELTAEGIRQARQLARQFARQPIDAVVSSDLNRAVQTARFVAESHGLPLDTTPLLRERDWGSFTGHYIPDLKTATWPDDIETQEALLHRAGLFLDFIRERYAGQQVFAVGHGIVNKAIQAVFYQKPMREVARMLNCEVRMLTL
jgi:probable phosphoglycerate mutase